MKLIMKLTENFTLSEFAVSETWSDLVKAISFSDFEIYKAWCLCRFILQPLRDTFGPIRILSGKRTPELNAKVGGVATSEHLWLNWSAAADIFNDSLYESHRWLMDCTQIGQCILYKKGALDYQFIHVSLPTHKHHNEFMIHEKGKYFK